MRKLTDLTGKKFNRLGVIKLADRDKWNNYRWLCLCDCGKETIVQGGHLKNGHTKSCGCLMIDKATIHGYSKRNKKNRTHQSWESMIKRCTKLNHKYWKYYGGRGITVCERWLTFENFLEDMGEVSEGRQIDRIDNNEGYCKSNCRWVTPKQNCRNTRHNVLITFNNKTQTIVEWSEETGIAYGTLVARISRYNWSPEKSLTTLVRKHKQEGIKNV